jgi:hypothetical protein
MSGVLFLSKEDIKEKVEPFIHARLTTFQYELNSIPSFQLLTYNRFDLGLKLAYLSYKDVLPELATEIYHHDIRSQTLGKFEEYGNEEKSSFDIYIEHFEKTFIDIKQNGFDENKTLVPLSFRNTILNGAHRVASAIFLNKDVTCVNTELDEIYPNYQYFIDRKVPEDILDIGAIKFCEYAENTYLAFLWPSGRENYNLTENLFSNIVYKKKIKLNSRGGLNLLIELYKHMDWVGTNKNNFPGAHQKLMECFTDFEEFTVILFQSESLEKVQEIKKRARDINQIGFSSVHITDTLEEVNRISRLIFNRNGLHFLNYGKPYKLKSTLSMVQCLHSLKADLLSRTVLDGSMTLSIYGIREARDIDYFSENVLPTNSCRFELESHDSQLIYHGLDKSELIHNPKYSFEYLGIKFVSFNQTFKFKKARNEEKDMNDCQMMISLIDNNGLKFFYSSLKQNFFYKKLVIKNRLQNFIFLILKNTGTYEMVRGLYRKLRGRK